MDRIGYAAIPFIRLPLVKFDAPRIVPVGHTALFTGLLAFITNSLGISRIAEERDCLSFPKNGLIFKYFHWLENVQLRYNMWFSP